MEKVHNLKSFCKAFGIKISILALPTRAGLIKEAETRLVALNLHKASTLYVECIIITSSSISIAAKTALDQRDSLLQVLSPLLQNFVALKAVS